MLNHRILLLGVFLTCRAVAQDTEAQQRDPEHFRTALDSFSGASDQDHEIIELLQSVVYSVGTDVPDGMAPWLDVLSLLLFSLDNNPNTRFASGWTPLHVLAFNPVQNSNVPFSDETEAQWIEGIRLLLDAGANPNIQDLAGQTPMHGASGFNSIEPVRLLLNAGADPNIPNIEGNTPLHNAISGENEEAVALLLEAGAQL